MNDCPVQYVKDLGFPVACTSLQSRNHPGALHIFSGKNLTQEQVSSLVSAARSLAEDMLKTPDFKGYYPIVTQETVDNTGRRSDQIPVLTYINVDFKKFSSMHDVERRVAFSAYARRTNLRFAPTMGSHEAAYQIWCEEQLNRKD